MRQNPSVRSYAVTHPVGEVRLPTQPGWHQILYAKTGLLTARTESDSWTVPPSRLLVIGDGTRLRVRTRRPTAVRCLYLRTEVIDLPQSIRVMEATPFTRELLLHTIDRCPLDPNSEVDAALVTLISDHLASLPTEALRMVFPRDGRALALAERLVADPARPLADSIAEVPASRRTLERIFARELRMTPASWQRRARVLAAIDLLVGGSSVSDAGATVGYSTPSSFVAAFRSELGTTPGAFIRDRRVEPRTVGDRPRR